MSYINENIKTNVNYDCDVLVAGGGFAGIAAALSAARQNKSVILLEKQFMLGGLGTAGLVTIYLPLCDGCGNQVSFGIAEELLKLSIKYGYEDRYPKAWLENGSKEEKAKDRYEVRYNAQLCAIAAEQLLLENGVKILYGTSVVASDTEGGKIKHIIIENKSGRSAISVKSVVDATGDADICVLSGENTKIFKQGNLLASWYYFAIESGYNLKTLGVCDIPDEEKTEQNEVKALIDRRFTGLDADELSEMVELSHASLLNDFIKEKKSDKSIMPVTIATIPQIRMTRRIDGLYTMTTSDDGKDFSDSVGMIGNWKKRGPVYQIPFGALYGEKIKNLIAAGRCISSDDAMWDVTRVIPACSVTGQAAGMAAALCDNFDKIDMNLLQKSLINAGVKIR